MVKSAASFDRKFGTQFLHTVPVSPGVYLIYDRDDALIYVGKAINLKRRLSQYRGILRRRKHRRMRGIVQEAARIEIVKAETHLEACLTETKLIQQHRPRWNVVGAYSFLYPLIGIRSVNNDLEFCLTTTPDEVLTEFPGFSFHGAFRSRRITGDAFFALMRLLRCVGHSNSLNRRDRIPRFSYLFSFRRLPAGWAELWTAFYKGESTLAMEELVMKLTESAAARRRPETIQEQLNDLKRFWRLEALSMAKVRKTTNFSDWPVPQSQRDLIFLSYRERAI